MKSNLFRKTFLSVQRTIEVLRNHGFEWREDVKAYDEFAETLFKKSKILTRDLILAVKMPLSKKMKQTLGISNS